MRLVYHIYHRDLPSICKLSMTQCKPCYGTRCPLLVSDLLDKAEWSVLFPVTKESDQCAQAQLYN